MSFMQVETTSNLDDGTCYGAGYIFEAACQVSQAQQHEANGHFEGAFESYKLGIGILLNGVQCNLIILSLNYICMTCSFFQLILMQSEGKLLRKRRLSTW